MTQMDMFKAAEPKSGLPAGFKPLLAAKVELENIKFPVICSPKIDGIRCIIDPNRGAISRELKPIPNKHIREKLNSVHPTLWYCDGELVTYTNNVLDDFNTIQSKVTSHNGTPHFALHIFDHVAYPEDPYWKRIKDLNVGRDDLPFVRIVPTVTCHNLDQLLALEQEYVDVLGWEGVMGREPFGYYKFGRSTFNQGLLWKMKRFQDDEAEIIGFKQFQHNANEAKVNALGHTERASLKENMVAMPLLGSFECKWKDVTFDLGTGFGDMQRQGYWNIRDKLIGKKVTFKYQGVGSNGRPRFPVFKGIRNLF